MGQQELSPLKREKKKLSTRHNQTTISYFSTTLSFLVVQQNILSIFLKQNLYRKPYTLILTESAFSRSSVLYRHHFLPSLMPSIYKCLVLLSMKYASHVRGGSTHCSIEYSRHFVSSTFLHLLRLFTSSILLLSISAYLFMLVHQLHGSNYSAAP